MAVSPTADQSGPKHRVHELSDHRSLLIPTATGQAEVGIAVTPGPLDINWLGGISISRSRPLSSM